MSKFIEQRTTEWVSAHMAGARSVLRSHGIAPGSRMSLDAAAAAASVTPDAIFAELAYRERLQARRMLRAPQEEHELELAIDW